MGKIKQLYQAMPLRRSLRWMFSITFFLVCMLSALAVFQMNRVQGSILERKEYFVDPVDGTYQHEPFTNKEAVVYYFCYAAMAGLPAVCLALGMAASARVFYRLKLQKPLAELQYGISKIAADDLDFTITYKSTDELGCLCMSMERMRRELCANNEKMWELLQKRKLLNASAAHDLRTPITVLRGYLDFLKEESKDKKMSDHEVCMAICGMDEAVQRMEQYVDCVQDIDSLENIKVQKKTENTAVFIEELKRDICRLGTDKDFGADIDCNMDINYNTDIDHDMDLDCGMDKNFDADIDCGVDIGCSTDIGCGADKDFDMDIACGVDIDLCVDKHVCLDKKIDVSFHIAQTELYIDKMLLFRIIENLVQNAVRYAKSRITVKLKTKGDVLTICVEDDGCGFQTEELMHAADLFYTTESSRHYGIGLNICRVICDKLDGTLSIENQEAGGARVTAAVKL